MSAIYASADKTTWSEDFGRAWNEFWFRPADPTLVSLLRIGVGLTALLHLASYSRDLVRWFGPDGLLPTETVNALLGGGGHLHPSYLSAVSSPSALWTLHVCGLIASLLLTVGLLSRTSAVVTALATLAIANRAPVICGQVEPALIFMLLYLAVAPAGAKYSLDSLLRPALLSSSLAGLVHRDEPSILANLSLRLMQVHLAAFYLMMGLAKTYGDAWWDGAAVWNLLAQTHSRPLDLTVLRGSEFLLNAWTHLIAWTLLLFPFLVWNRFSRPIALVAAGIMWHLMIPLTGLVSFCLLMIVALACFVPPQLIDRWQKAAKA
jgi:hypothetical protein